MKKFFLGAGITIGVIVLLLVIAAVLLTTILAKDIASPNTEDLKVTRLKLDDADNAFTYLAQATNITENVNFSQISREITNNIELALSLVNSNRSQILLIDRASECKYLQMPEITSFEELRIQNCSMLRQQARLKALQTRLLFVQGEEDEAIKNALRIIKLGKMMENSGGVIITYLVAIAIENIGLDLLKDMIPLTSISSDKLITYAATLSENDYTACGLAKSMKAEYKLSSMVIDNIFSTNKIRISDLTLKQYIFDFPIPVKSYFFLPNLTKKYIADDIRRIIKYSSKPYNANDINYFEEKEEDASLLSMMSRKNGIGIALQNLVSPVYLPVLDRHYYTGFSRESIRLLLAIKAYKIDHGQLPDNLNVLVPHYIHKVPQDPYDGKMIRYNKDKRIIYSVGKNSIDDGGVDITDKKQHIKKWNAKDIVFKIEL